MNLKRTDALLRAKRAQGAPVDYAVLVRRGAEKAVLTAPGVNETTCFDAASMTKVLATSTLLLRLLSEGALSLSDTLDRFFDDLPPEKRVITVEQLLTHTSGIVRETIPCRDAACGKAAIERFILAKRLAFAPGSEYRYSCNGYILLGFIVEKLSGMPLDEAFAQWIARPLGLERSCFSLPLDAENAVKCHRWKEAGGLRVDDENAYALGGVAGNAGLFTCLADMQKIIEALLRRETRLYERAWFDEAERNRTPNLSEGRGLGYLVVNEQYRQAGKLFPPGSFGHCGHTGQSFFIDRTRDLYAVVLTNATRSFNALNHFWGMNYDDVKTMREEIHNAIAEDLQI